jgi:hypothetical protein
LEIDSTRGSKGENIHYAGSRGDSTVRIFVSLHRTYRRHARENIPHAGPIGDTPERIFPMRYQ